MSDDSLLPGKLPHGQLACLLGQFGRLPAEIRVGPEIGEDAAVIDIPGGVLVTATDPVTLASADVGELAVIVNANDVAVTGARPRWFLATVLVPSGTAAAVVGEIFASMKEALDRIGASLVGGHTEVTEAVTAPVVVGHMLGVIESGSPIATKHTRPGDRILQVGPAPLEGGAVLAHEAVELLDSLDPITIERARAGRHRPGLSIVEPTLIAANLGAHSLHDPTEGGLAAGLHEMARAAGVRLRIDRAAVAWYEPAVQVCRALGADPWATLASGTLLAALPPSDTNDAAAELASQGYQTSIIGRAERGSGLLDEEGKPIHLPVRDEVVRILSSSSPPCTPASKPEAQRTPTPLADTSGRSSP
ncbi:MAG: AIR synthase-related protein [Actinomycetia bacterium]|nr:AIR synthase-related protein [Actinomycetes bacterium]